MNGYKNKMKKINLKIVWLDGFVEKYEIPYSANAAKRENDRLERFVSLRSFTISDESDIILYEKTYPDRKAYHPPKKSARKTKAKA